MMKNIFECDLIFFKYRCICVDIGNTCTPFIPITFKSTQD